jgi:hypothetical protein
MLGKLVHIGFDAILISALLAGVKRSTGLTCVSPFPLAFAKRDARIELKPICLVLCLVLHVRM